MRNLKQFLIAVWQLNKWVPLLLGGILLLDLTVYAYLSYRVEPELAQKERTYIELQSRARKARQVEAADLDPRQAFRRGQVDLEKFLERVPERRELSALVGELFSFARKSSLDIKAINYKPDSLPDQELLEYTLSFAVAGDYDQVKKFIHFVEQAGRLVAIDQLKLDRGGKDEGRVKLSIRMTTYFRAGVAS